MLWLNLSWSGFHFCKQRLEYGRCKFFSLPYLKCLKIKNKYTGHLPKLVFGQCCVVTRYSIEKQHFTKDKTYKEIILVTSKNKGSHDIQNHCGLSLLSHPLTPKSSFSKNKRLGFKSLSKPKSRLSQIPFVKPDPGVQQGIVTQFACLCRF